MKIIERLKRIVELIGSALLSTMMDDYLSCNHPRLKAAIDHHQGIHSLAVVDMARIRDLRPEERKQALGIMNSLLRLTRQAMGPGEWFQVIRRNRHDGRFAGEPEQERDLFNE